MAPQHGAVLAAALLRLLRLSTAVLRCAECRVHRRDAVAGAAAPTEAENVRLVIQGPASGDRDETDRSQP
jgi:hypothetical protein